MSDLFRVKCPNCGTVQDLPGYMTNTVILEYALPEEMPPL